MRGWLLATRWQGVVPARARKISGVLGLVEAEVYRKAWRMHDLAVDGRRMSRGAGGDARLGGPAWSR